MPAAPIGAHFKKKGAIYHAVARLACLHIILMMPLRIYQAASPHFDTIISPYTGSMQTITSLLDTADFLRRLADERRTYAPLIISPAIIEKPGIPPIEDIL